MGLTIRTIDNSRIEYLEDGVGCQVPFSRDSAVARTFVDCQAVSNPGSPIRSRAVYFEAFGLSKTRKLEILLLVRAAIEKRPIDQLTREYFGIAGLTLRTAEEEERFLAYDFPNDAKLASLKSLYDLQFEIVKRTPFYLQSSRINPLLKRDEELAFLIVNNDGRSFRYLDPLFQNDRTFVEGLLAIYPLAYLELSEALKNDFYIAHHAVRSAADIIRVIPRSVPNYLSLVNDALLLTLDVVRWFKEDFRTKKEFFRLLKTTEFFSYEFLSLELQKDEKFLLECIGENRAFFSTIPHEISMDRRFLTLALLKNAGIYLDLPLEAKEDEGISCVAVSVIGRLLEFVPLSLRERSYKVCHYALRNDGLALEFVPSPLRNDLELINLAVRQNGGAIEFVSREIESFDRLVVKAFETYSPAISMCSSSFFHSIKGQLALYAANPKVCVEAFNIPFRPELKTDDYYFAICGISTVSMHRILSIPNESLKSEIIKSLFTVQSHDLLRYAVEFYKSRRDLFFPIVLIYSYEGMSKERFHLTQRDLFLDLQRFYLANYEQFFVDQQKNFNAILHFLVSVKEARVPLEMKLHMIREVIQQENAFQVMQMLTLLNELDDLHAFNLTAYTSEYVEQAIADQLIDLHLIDIEQKEQFIDQFIKTDRFNPLWNLFIQARYEYAKFKAIKTLVQDVLSGQFETKRVEESPHMLLVERGIIDRWVVTDQLEISTEDQLDKEESDRGVIIVDSADPVDLLRIENSSFELNHTVIDKRSYSPGFLGKVLDGKNRVVLVKNHLGKVIGQSRMRLLFGRDGLGVYVDGHEEYPSFSEQIVQFAKQKAEVIGAKAYVAGDRVELTSVLSRFPDEVVDETRLAISSDTIYSLGANPVA